jgi:hypothetical protein
VFKTPAKNVQVTFDSSSKQARSESVVAANPGNPDQIVRFEAIQGRHAARPDAPRTPSHTNSSSRRLD